MIFLNYLFILSKIYGKIVVGDDMKKCFNRLFIIVILLLSLFLVSCEYLNNNGNNKEKEPDKFDPSLPINLLYFFVKLYTYIFNYFIINLKSQ